MPKTEEERLEDLREQELYDLETAKDKIEAIYKTMPQVIAQVARLTGLSPEMVFRASISASWFMADRTWYQLLDTIRAFHVEVRRFTQEENGEEV